MNITNSDLKNKYDACRQMTDSWGKVYIMTGDNLDAVLLSVCEYEKLVKLSEQNNNPSLNKIIKCISSIPAKGRREIYTLAQLKNDLKLVER